MDCSELHGFKGDPILTINKTKCYLYVKEITICVDILLDILQQKLYEKYHIFFHREFCLNLLFLY